MARGLNGVFLLVGSVLLAWGAYIPAKAWLGQQLLERAWRDGRVSGSLVRPWAWADLAPVARLSFEDGAALIVLSGATGQSLAWGPGHVDGTAWPGEPGNAVVAGHQDTHFARLQAIEAGAMLEAESLQGMRARYRVRSTQVVMDSDLRWLAPDYDGLTLVTCFPFGGPPGGRARFVVRADRVDLPDLPRRSRRIPLRVWTALNRGALYAPGDSTYEDGHRPRTGRR
ncbi:MAG: class GN sortase [Myxococcota bacterium]